MLTVVISAKIYVYVLTHLKLDHTLIKMAIALNC